MKVDYQAHIADLNKKSRRRIREIVREPKVAFTSGDFQREMSPDRFARMVRQVVRDW